MPEYTRFHLSVSDVAVSVKVFWICLPQKWHQFREGRFAQSLHHSTRWFRCGEAFSCFWSSARYILNMLYGSAAPPSKFVGGELSDEQMIWKALWLINENILVTVGVQIDGTHTFVREGTASAIRKSEGKLPLHQKKKMHRTSPWLRFLRTANLGRKQHLVWASWLKPLYTTGMYVFLCTVLREWVFPDRSRINTGALALLFN